MPKREYVTLDVEKMRKTLADKNVKLSVFCRLSSVDYNHLNDHLTHKVKTTKRYRDNVMSALDNIDNTERWEKYRAWQNGEDDGLDDTPITAAEIHNNWT